MSGTSHVAVVVNPASGGGKGGQRLPKVREAFARHGITDIRLTERRGNEADQVRAAIAAGASTIVIVGGDGTWGRCAGAVVAEGAAERVRLAFVAAGTGNDFAKNLDAPAGDVEAMAALVASGGNERRVDVGVVESAGERHYFLNCAGFGFDAIVLADLEQGGSKGGVGTYVVAALKRLVGYPGFAYTEGGPHGVSRLAMMLIAMNGAWFGGAFRIAPDARIDDGKLDVVEIGDARWFTRLRLFAKAMKGTHVWHSRVRVRRGEQTELSFSDAPWCDLDGELVRFGSKDCLVRCLRGVVRAVVR